MTKQAWVRFLIFVISRGGFEGGEFAPEPGDAVLEVDGEGHDYRNKEKGRRRNPPCSGPVEDPIGDD